MALAPVNGITLSYEVAGPEDGTLVVLVMGTGSPGRVWRLHQVPALVAAGYRVATPDNRGIPPTDAGDAPFTVEDLVADVAALIEHLSTSPAHPRAHVVGTSLGARVALDLALTRPDLVISAVALAAHARLGPLQRATAEGEIALIDAGVTLPPRYRAAASATSNLSPATLADDRAAQDWLEILEFSASAPGPGLRAQEELSLTVTDRRAAYAGLRVPLLAVGYADDRVIPPAMAREVADAAPTARYAEVADAGHYGYLERPEQINRLILDFLQETA